MIDYETLLKRLPHYEALGTERVFLEGLLDPTQYPWENVRNATPSGPRFLLGSDLRLSGYITLEAGAVKGAPSPVKLVWDLKLMDYPPIVIKSAAVENAMERVPTHVARQIARIIREQANVLARIALNQTRELQVTLDAHASLTQLTGVPYR